MKYTEEEIANNAYLELVNYFNSQKKEISIKKEGAGVHWSCILFLSDRKCKIHCFSGRPHKNEPPEYLTSFIENEIDIAWSRTKDLNQTILSCEAWLDSKILDFLYEKFSFVDKQKRRIKYIQNQLISHYPELKGSSISFENNICDSYDLTFKTSNRACTIGKLGLNEVYSFHFYWEDSWLFSAENEELEKVGLAIKKWLIDKTPPSILEKELKWIKTGELAKYYEKGEGTIGEFIQSWEEVKGFYEGIGFPFSKDVLALLSTLKEKGYHKLLRAGTSLSSLILSRSKKHGLGDSQKFIHFSFSNKDDKMSVANEKSEKFMFEKIELNEKLENLIKNLSKAPIDKTT